MKDYLEIDVFLCLYNEVLEMIFMIMNYNIYFTK